MTKIVKVKTATKPKAVEKPKAKSSTTTKTVKAGSAKKAFSPYKETLTKSELIKTMAETTELTKKQVSLVLDTLSDVISAHINKRAIGQFTMPGLFKIVVQKKPATKARKGISPFNGEETTFKAKPARRVVKIRALKKLKEMTE